MDFKDYSQQYMVYRTADMDLINYKINNLNIEKNMKILDSGCGTGNY